MKLRLKELRQRAKPGPMTQKKLAQKLGVKQPAISYWETTGSIDPTLIPAICIILKCSPNELFGYSEK